MPRLVDVDTQSVAIGDTYERLASLLGLTFLRGRIKDATLRFATSGVTLVYSPTDPGSSAGDAYAATEGLSWGDAELGWLIQNIWLKETTAGGGATLVFAGLVEVE